MIDTVIVALDGSELAEQALPLAKQLAEHMEAELFLLQVIRLDAPADTRDEARVYLEETARTLGIPAQVMVRIGQPAEEIIASAVDVPESIIVMTTHGRGGLGRLLYGSVAERVVLDSRIPVLLIRAGLVPSATEPLKSILVSLDGSAYAETALPQAIELARAFDADLWLARVAVANMALGGPTDHAVARRGVPACGAGGRLLSGCSGRATRGYRGAGAYTAAGGLCRGCDSRV